MKSSLITAVISTIGRASLSDAIFSATREFEKVIVVADVVDLNFNELPTENISYFKIGRKNDFDHYGARAWNLGAYVADTPYINQLGDDDEFAEGAGEFMENKIKENPDVDIWITGLKYSDGSFACMGPSLGPGNVAAPTYKTELFSKVPFANYLVDPESQPPRNNPHFIDFLQVENLVNKFGAKIDWYGKDLYLVRPKLSGNHGFGQI